MDVVYGQRWNMRMRFIIDVITGEEARLRYAEGPWFTVAVGNGLCTTADEAHAAQDAHVSLPMPEFSADLEAGAESVRVSFYDANGSVAVIHRWRTVGERIFLESVIFYTYPDEPRLHRHDESRVIHFIDFGTDGTSRESIRDKVQPAAEKFVPTTNIVDHDDVPLDKHYEPIPEFGDWAVFGHRDRYPRPTP